MENVEQSLLLAVRENPFDDTPRLILAEWYQENDQAERAEFIYNQIKNPSDEYRAIGTITIDKNYKLDPCSKTPIADLLSSFIQVSGIWRRGFVDEIHCTQEVFIGSLCGRCNGHGIGNDRIEGTAMRLGCGLCNGVGHIGGIAKRVGESWPVTKVFITDAIVHSSFGADYFYLGGLGMFPSRYWRALDNHRSRNDVRNALERVCVSYMRELANLPPLDGFTF